MAKATLSRSNSEEGYVIYRGTSEQNVKAVLNFIIGCSGPTLRWREGTGPRKDTLYYDCDGIDHGCSMRLLCRFGPKPNDNFIKSTRGKHFNHKLLDDPGILIAFHCGPKQTIEKGLAIASGVAVPQETKQNKMSPTKMVKPKLSCSNIKEGNIIYRGRNEQNVKAVLKFIIGCTGPTLRWREGTGMRKDTLYFDCAGIDDGCSMRLLCRFGPKESDNFIECTHGKHFNHKLLDDPGILIAFHCGPKQTIEKGLAIASGVAVPSEK
uniref:Uncharacterized protein n=1 Tax=Meloidogyne javanica TaxID=6303 RepID=A0A915LX78_MELJA